MTVPFFQFSNPTPSSLIYLLVQHSIQNSNLELGLPTFDCFSFFRSQKWTPITTAIHLLRLWFSLLMAKSSSFSTLNHPLLCSSSCVLTLASRVSSSAVVKVTSVSLFHLRFIIMVHLEFQLENAT